ncbi:MAG: prolipoprotein diacylglyceryl transferase [Nitrospinae bacterium]|nr:prolipoprotein diacylglyceryl transferase [Nitrospinota bacterium]
MFPVLFNIGPLTLHTYGLLVATGLFTGVYLSALRAGKEGYNRDVVLDLGFYIVLAAIIGSRLLYVIVEYKTYLDSPLRVFKIWEGGLVFFGGVLGAIPVAVWFLRKHKIPFWPMADIFAPYVALAHGIGRLGCLAAGCCYGRPTTSWLGVTFTSDQAIARPLNTPLLPTQLFDSVNEITIFLILLVARNHKRFDGQLILLWLMLYSVGRFIVEIYRGDPRGWIIEGVLSTSQGVGIAVFVVSAFVFVKLWKRKSA